MRSRSCIRSLNSVRAMWVSKASPSHHTTACTSAASAGSTRRPRVGLGAIQSHCSRNFLGVEQHLDRPVRTFERLQEVVEEAPVGRRRGLHLVGPRRMLAVHLGEPIRLEELRERRPAAVRRAAQFDGAERLVAQRIVTFGAWRVFESQGHAPLTLPAAGAPECDVCLVLADLDARLVQRPAEELGSRVGADGDLHGVRDRPERRGLRELRAVHDELDVRRRLHALDGVPLAVVQRRPGRRARRSSSRC